MEKFRNFELYFLLQTGSKKEYKTVAFDSERNSFFGWVNGQAKQPDSISVVLNDGIQTIPVHIERGESIKKTGNIVYSISCDNRKKHWIANGRITISDDKARSCYNIGIDVRIEPRNEEALKRAEAAFAGFES